MAMEICLKSFSKFLMLARACALNIIASHEHNLYCTMNHPIFCIYYYRYQRKIAKPRNRINRSVCKRERREKLTDSEHGAEDAEDDSNETGVIYGEILRGHDRSLVRQRRRWQPWIVWLLRVRRHLFSLSLCLWVWDFLGRITSDPENDYTSLTASVVIFP